jgi:tRNA pseudouridine55 synthase
VVQQVRRALRTRAAGHTGTLDPFATGLLVIMVGRATRLARFVESQAKTYLATARLGFGTTTDDFTGEVSGPISSARVSEARLRDVLEGFLGVQLQRPPQFSAKRVGGERSYRKARRGESVELAAVSVTVHRIDLVGYQPPEVTFRLVVSAGTYVRAVARDLGERLGVGAHLISLRREAIGALRVENALSVHHLGPAALLPPEAVLGNLPVVRLSESERQAVQHGRAVVDSGSGGQRESGEAVALLESGELIGVARAEGGRLLPVVVLAGHG